MKCDLGPASRSLDISSAAKAGLVVIAIMLAAGSGCNKLSRSEIRSETADAVQKQTDDMRSLREVDPKLVKYRQVDVIETGFERATGIALGPDGTLFVAGDNAVRVFSPDGRVKSELQLAAAPYCLAVAGDGTGTIYVGFQDHVEVYGNDGQLQARWRSLAQKAYLTCLAVSGEDIWAADAGNRVVLHYSKSGELLGKIGEPDESSDSAQFIVPSPHLDILLTGDNLLVNNPGCQAVQTYTTRGELQSSWGHYSQNIDGFCGCCNPTDIAVLPDGKIVTSEKGLPRVKVYSPDGKFECVVATPDDFSAKAAGLDLAVSDDGRVFVLDPPAGTVKVFARKQ